ncbi:MAG: TIGR00282 family metallophosphoesterase [Firmicutes bacterium]|uniref:TIGR00282 family metallophosphoesterase n=1 Tax=Candidatus Scatoplasma merdavium TaxID=2840932 RepID=A0A9D9GS88_9BACL|nr:TIGR00282 family metallophosphoesterase [Candidatus Scatoplasma merdavium]
MNILFIGDIVGKIGRRMLKEYLPNIRKEHHIDLVIANGENVTHGKGLSSNHYKELIEDGVDCITMGNHHFRVKEILEHPERYPLMIRPANFSKYVPGSGTIVFSVKGKTVRITNIIGKVFIDGADANPFQTLDEIVASSSEDIHIVDFHAEASAEKIAMAMAFDGKITALLGTHTHVQTNDPRFLSKGTFELTDVGMCGGSQTIIGVNKEEVIYKNFSGIPQMFQLPSDGIGQCNSILLKISEETNKVTNFEFINVYE